MKRKEARGDQWKGLSTERRDPASSKLDLLSPEGIASRILSADASAVAVARANSKGLARIAREAARAWGGGGRVFYVGAGTSGRLGTLDAAELPPTFGLPFGRAIGVVAGGPRALRRSVEGAEDHAAEGARAMRRVRLSSHDFVLGISASSLAPFVRGALAEARARGVRTALLTMNRPPRAKNLAHLVVVLPVGREIIRGSTRMKSGTVTKVALHTISTTAMVLLGKVWEGEMVDLRPWCAKLHARARRILEEHLGLSPEGADLLFRDAGEDLRVALVMGGRGASRTQARRLLASARGRLRAVLPKSPRG